MEDFQFAVGFPVSDHLKVTDSLLFLSQGIALMLLILRTLKLASIKVGVLACMFGMLSRCLCVQANSLPWSCQ